MTLIAALLGMAVAGGVLLIIAGLRPAPPTTGPKHQALWLRQVGQVLGLVGPGRLTRHRQLLLASAGAGLLLGLLTGWYILVIVLPAAVVGLPPLIRPGRTMHAIDKLGDLETWVRGLSGILVGGATGLEQALRSSLGSAPPSVRPALARLVARLDAQQPIRPALLLWADEMNDYSSDLIAAALILESERRSGGVTRALEELADSVADQTRARRQVETERSKPRSTARLVTIFTLLVIGLMIITGTYLEPYKTPLGQAAATTLLSLYAACLLWMRKIGIGKPVPRFLPHSDERR